MKIKKIIVLFMMFILINSVSAQEAPTTTKKKAPPTPEELRAQRDKDFAAGAVSGIFSSYINEIFGPIIQNATIDYCKLRIGASNPASDTPSSSTAPTPPAPPPPVGQDPPPPPPCQPSAAAQLYISSTSQPPFQYSYSWAVLACTTNIPYTVSLRKGGTELNIATGTSLAYEQPAGDTSNIESNTEFEEICIFTQSQIGNPCFPGVFV